MTPANKRDLLPGTLDMLILGTLAVQSMHGYGIAQHIQRLSRDVLRIEVLAKLGRTHHVHEEDRDGLELLLALRSCAQGGKLFLQGRDRHGDHCIAQHRTLRF